MFDIRIILGWLAYHDGFHVLVSVFSSLLCTPLSLSQSLCLSSLDIMIAAQHCFATSNRKGCAAAVSQRNEQETVPSRHHRWHLSL